MTIEPIYDSEDELWFAGTRTGLPYGPMSQRGAFYAWPDVNGENPDSAQPYQTRDDAQTACDALNAMTERELRSLSPDYFGDYEPPQSLAQRTMVITADDPDFA